MPSLYETLFAYHWHITGRLLAGAEQLTEAEYHDHPGYGHGSVHDLFVHVLRALQGWRVALETGQQTVTSTPEDFPTLAAVREAFVKEQAAWDELLASYDETTVAGNVTLTNLRGNTYAMPLWRVLQHLILHGMQHHTELAQLLTAKGQSPGDIDFIFFRG
jgi:uncharacterized damage-inducible protein DinB